MKQNKKKLLVFSSSVGSGHVKAAEALCQTYREKFDGEADHVDFLECLNPAFTQLMRKSHYLATRHVPEIYRKIYKVVSKEDVTPIKKLGSHLGFKKYCQLIEKYNPDLILSTNFLPAAAASVTYSRFSIPNGVVLTDYASHGMWVHPNNQKFFVAQDKMVDELRRFGIDKSKICVSGIPVESCFTKPQDKIELRRKLNLALDKPTILLMGGGSSIGPFSEVLESLSKVNLDLQVLVIVGHDKKVHQELQQHFRLLGLKGKVLGFVDNVYEYMMASDLLISKAGGLTTTETLVVGLPMIIIKSIPGQEDGNIKFLTKIGAGIYAKDMGNLNLLVEDLLNNQNKLHQMSENSRKYAKPESAMTILKEMINLK